MRLKKSLVILILLFLISPAYANTEIFTVDIEEITEDEGDLGFVSTAAKNFRLIVDHDPDYIPAEKKENFDRKKSIFLTNLNIIKRDLNRKTKNAKEVRSDYKFEIEEDSYESPSTPGFLRSTYISNEQIIKKGQRLSFKIKLFDYLDDFLSKQDLGENSGLLKLNEIKTKANKKIDINSLELKFTSVNFLNSSNNGDSLSFTAKKKENDLSKIESENLSIIAFAETNKSLSSSIKNSSFKTKSESGKAIKAKIKKDGKIKNSKKHRLTVKSLGDISISDNGNNLYKFSIPIKLESKNRLSNAEREDLAKLDLLIVPVILDLKTNDSLDMNISGTLRESTNLIFDVNGDF